MSNSKKKRYFYVSFFYRNEDNSDEGIASIGFESNGFFTLSNLTKSCQEVASKHSKTKIVSIVIITWTELTKEDFEVFKSQT